MTPEEQGRLLYYEAIADLLQLGVVPLLTQGNALANALRPIRIGLLGDSETGGSAYPGTYRIAVFNRAYGAGIRFKLCGKNAANPSANVIEEGSEGFPGYTIQLLRAQVLADLPDLALDVASVMIGTNNCTAADSTAVNIANYTQMMDDFCATSPDTWWSFLTIPPVDNAKVSVATIDPVKRAALNAAIPGIVTSRAAMGKRVKFADACANVLLADMGLDGQHMGIGGNAKVGEAVHTSFFFDPSPSRSAPPIAYAAIPSGFTPHSLAGCTAEIYAENAVVVANEVQSIPDVSGAGHMAIAFGAPKPAFQNYSSETQGPGGFGGSLPGNSTAPMIVTDGVQNGLDFGVPVLGTASWTAFFVVGKGHALPNAEALLGQFGGGHTTLLYTAAQGADLGAQVDAGLAQISAKGPGYVFAVLGLRWDGATVSLVKDGTVIRSAGALVGIGGNGNTSLGVIHVGGGVFGNFTWNAFVGYDTAKSDAEMLLVSRYLGQRYGLAVP